MRGWVDGAGHIAEQLGAGLRIETMETAIGPHVQGGRLFRIGGREGEVAGRFHVVRIEGRGRAHILGLRIDDIASLDSRLRMVPPCCFVRVAPAQIPVGPDQRIQPPGQRWEAPNATLLLGVSNAVIIIAGAVAPPEGDRFAAVLVGGDDAARAALGLLVYMLRGWPGDLGNRPIRIDGKGHYIAGPVPAVEAALVDARVGVQCDRVGGHRGRGRDGGDDVEEAGQGRPQVRRVIGEERSVRLAVCVLVPLRRGVGLAVVVGVVELSVLGGVPEGLLEESRGGFTEVIGDSGRGVGDLTVGVAQHAGRVGIVEALTARVGMKAVLRRTAHIAEAHGVKGRFLVCVGSDPDGPGPRVDDIAQGALHVLVSRRPARDPPS